MLAGFEGVARLEFRPHADDRGTWQRCWDSDLMQTVDMDPRVSQVSFSHSPKIGTLRGLHMLSESMGETKSVFVVSGEIQDVVVDLRKSSPNYLEHLEFRLSAGQGIAIPPGVAHGFLTLVPDVSMVYVMSVPYSEKQDLGFSYNDPAFGISWADEPKHVSRRDLSHSFIDVEA